MHRLRSAACLLLAAAAPAPAIDEAHRKLAAEMSARAADYLRAQQDPATGGWAVSGEGPTFPAITGLVLTGMLLQPGITPADGAVVEGVQFLLDRQQPDGGIYDRGILPSYNTAIAVSALARIDTREAREAVARAQGFLRGLQYGETAVVVPGREGEQAQRVGPEHPFYGGVGYGSQGRPDLSNLAFFLQAMEDSGVPGDDPSVQRAVAFLSRVQMWDPTNEMAYADGARQGGFIYSTSAGSEPAQVGIGQSMAGQIEETLDDGTKVSRLRAYGSMTYAGFKSLIYAQLARDDERVLAAHRWIREHYTLEENPGCGTDGLYYYFVMLARALDAWGPATIAARAADGTETQRDWENDLVDRLARLQNEDGSFKSVDDRWMENNPVLITAYAMIALGHATN